MELAVAWILVHDAKRELEIEYMKLEEAGKGLTDVRKII